MKNIKKIGIIALIIAVTTISVSYKSGFFEVAKQIEIYTTLFKELNMYYIDETNPAELTDVAIDNMLKNLDPYTQYYDEQGVENAKINAMGEYGGIGATSSYVNNKLIIIETYEDSPADNADIKPGDEIIMVDDVLVSDYKSDAVIALLQGLPKTRIKLKLKRQNRTFEVELIRQKIEINPVPYYRMIDDEVGYISFIKFNRKASDEVKNAYEDLKDQGMTKLILDVRGNLGGLVNEAIEIVNFFVPKNEIVVTTKAKVVKWSDTYKTKKEPLDLEIPLVVLIDGRSASASEILAGSLQDLDRAIIVGERSFGKGLVQRYRKLTYGTQLKLTISKYYTPSGRSIQELDYSHRNENGDVPKFSDKERNAFKTKNGRTVYDGGGIQPDIKFERPEQTEATKSLLKSNAIFDFATNYYYAHDTIESSKDFQLSDNDFQSFISYLKSDTSGFKTNTELVFEKALLTAEKESYDGVIEGSYNNIIEKINEKKIEELDLNKDEILDYLKEKILNRYYYKKGEYINKVFNDKAITQASKLLKNEKKYIQILN